VTLVVGDREHKFADALAREVKAGAPATMLNGSLRDSFSDRAAAMSRIGGVKTVVAGAATAHAQHTPMLFETTAQPFLREPQLREEAFGPGGIVVECESADQALACVDSVGGNLTGTVHIGKGEDRQLAAFVLRKLECAVGRMVVNGYPTGVEVGRAIVH